MNDWLPEQDVQRPTAHFQRVRRVVVGDAAVRLRLPCIARVVQQGRLSVVLGGFIQLYSRLAMKELWRDKGFSGG